MATTHYLWDRLENNVVGEFDGSGNVVASYVTKPQLYGDVMSQRRADSGARYYHTDALGTVTELTDQGGNVTDTFRSTAFGDTAESTGATPSPYKYVGAKGYYVDGGLESLAVRGRRYSPNSARWLSVDPLSQGTPLGSRLAQRGDITGAYHIDKSPLPFPLDSTIISVTDDLARMNHFAFSFPRLSTVPSSEVFRTRALHGNSAYEYGRNNPIKWVDPSGLEDVCGPFVWLYTGSWCIDEQHYYAAMHEAGLSVTRTAKCWWNCEVTIHKTALALLGLDAGARHLTFTHLQITKPPDLQIPTLQDQTTLQRLLAQRLRERGYNRLAERLHRAATQVSRRPIATGIGSFAKGVVIVECLFSIACSIKCAYEEMR